MSDFYERFQAAQAKMARDEQGTMLQSEDLRREKLQRDERARLLGMEVVSILRQSNIPTLNIVQTMETGRVVDNYYKTRKIHEQIPTVIGQGWHILTTDHWIDSPTSGLHDITLGDDASIYDKFSVHTSGPSHTKEIHLRDISECSDKLSVVENEMFAYFIAHLVKYGHPYEQR